MRSEEPLYRDGVEIEHLRVGELAVSDAVETENLAVEPLAVTSASSVTSPTALP
jgi:hypothetical protein